MKSKNQRLTEILFVIYMVTLIWMIIFKMQFSFSEVDFMRNINLDPYAAPARIEGEIVYEEIYFNIIAFLPLGLYAEILFKKWNIFQKVMLFFFISLSFEIIQYTFAIGASDVTDLINNVIGGIIGLLIYKGIEKWLENRHQTHKLINVIAAIATILVVTILFILKIMY